jgi:hypothetical protein
MGKDPRLLPTIPSPDTNVLWVPMKCINQILCDTLGTAFAPIKSKESIARLFKHFASRHKLLFKHVFNPNTFNASRARDRV